MEYKEKKRAQENLQVSKLPKELIQYWEEHGHGALLGGFIRFCLPQEMHPFVQRGYPNEEKAVPFATTAFGDILVWRDDRYVDLLHFSKGSSDVILSGFEFFFPNMSDADFTAHYFPLADYQEAKAQLGPLKEDECYGYVPLLKLGGREDINSLQICKLKEHLELILQVEGK